MHALELPAHFTRAEAIGAGLTRSDIDRALLDGDLRRLGWGWYGIPLPERAEERWERTRRQHLDQVAFHLRWRTGHVASHASAAVVHGLALIVSAGSPVELTSVQRYPASRRLDDLVLHHADSVEAEVVLVNDLRVTDVDRTIADCLRTRTLPHGVAMLDDALRRGLTTLDRVRATLKKQVRWRGRPRALAAVHLADPRRESWLESYSFVTLHQGGLEMPVPQVAVLDEDDHFVGRTDGMLTRYGVFGEADGLGKYFMDGDPWGEGYAAAVARVLEQERARHAALERLGLRGVRWTGEEIMRRPQDVVQRFQTAVQRANPANVRGSIVVDGRRLSIPCDLDVPSLGDRVLRYRRGQPL